MEYRGGMTICVTAALLFAHPAGAQDQRADAESYKFSVRSNLVFLPTRVQSKSGETIYGLKAEQFIVEDNGIRQPVTVDEDPDSTGLSLVVAVQCSRSAPTEFKKLKGLGAMIDAIVGDAPHEVSILSYGEGPYVLGDFSGSPDAVRLALSRLRPCGSYGAATIDAVYYAINMLNRRQSHYRRAILLIGETRDHGSRSKLHEVVAELGVTDTVIYSVAFSPARDEIIQGLRYGDRQAQTRVFTPPPSPPSPSSQSATPEATAKEPVIAEHAPLLALPPQIMPVINALRRNASAELASLSGGEYINFTTQRDFEQGLQRISNQIHNYYLLSFKPSSAPMLALHSLRVRVADHPDAVIQTRRSYWYGILDSSAAGGTVP